MTETIETIKAQSTLFSGVLQFFMLGFLQSWGNISVQISSQMRLNDNTIVASDLINGHSVQFITFACSLWVSPVLFRIMDHRLILLISQILGVGGIQLGSLVSTSPLYLFMTMNVGFGFMVGTGYMPLIQCSMLWFPDHKGVITGIIVATLGGSTMLLNIITDFLINPDSIDPIQEDGDIQFPENIAQRVPGAIRQLAMIFGILALVVMCISFKPETNVDVENVDNLEKKESVEHKESLKDSEKVLKAVMSKNFILLQFNNVLTMSTCIMITSLQGSQGLERGQGVTEMAWIGQLGSINNGWGRIFLSWLADNYNFKTTQMTMIIIQIVSLLMLSFIDNFAIYMIFTAAIFWVTGGHFVNTIVYYNKIQEKQIANELYGYQFTSFLAASLLTFPMKILYQETSQLVLTLTLIGTNSVTLFNVVTFLEFEDIKVEYIDIKTNPTEVL